MRPVSPPCRVVAETFHEELLGSHEPLLLTARGADDKPLQCVVKLLDRLDGPANTTPYLCEWVASEVARTLGIATPVPLAVDITPAFVKALRGSQDLVRAAQRSCGLAFGCEFWPGYVQWTPSTGVHAEQFDAAVEILGFDLLIHNFDRTITSPNLLVGRDEIVAIDHDLAFEFVYPPPRFPDLATNPRVDVLLNHPLGRALKGQALDFTDFIQGLGELSDAWLASVRQAAPAEWTVGRASEALDTILAVLAKRRDHAANWLDQVKAWMA